MGGEAQCLLLANQHPGTEVRPQLCSGETDADGRPLGDEFILAVYRVPTTTTTTTTTLPGQTNPEPATTVRFGNVCIRSPWRCKIDGCPCSATCGSGTFVEELAVLQQNGEFYCTRRERFTPCTGLDPCEGSDGGVNGGVDGSAGDDSGVVGSNSTAGVSDGTDSSLIYITREWWRSMTRLAAAALPSYEVS